MSSVLSTPVSASTPTPSGPPAVNPVAQGEACYAKGMAYLLGAGEAENPGMAVASFLDGADLGHAESILKAALLYYIGAGVSRSLPSAHQYANQYLATAPSGRNTGAAREILGESLGTENARRLLVGDAVAAVQSDAAAAVAKGNRGTLWLGIVAGLVVIAAAAGALLLHTRSAVTLSTDIGDIATLIPTDERSQAHMQALAIAARLHTVAANAEKQRQAEAAAAEARAKSAAAAQAEEQRRADERAATEAEAQKKAAEAVAEANARTAEAQAVAEANARTAAAQAVAEAKARTAAAQPSAIQSNSNGGQKAQLQAMYSSALDALHHGQYDRASGIADSLLAIAPGDPTLLRLKTYIQWARQNPSSRTQIR